MAKTKIGIIGAGMAGLRLARLLSDSADVSVFEKSRGFGGRMSTRRVDGFQFDHGAQYFTAKSADFSSFLAPYVADGTVVEWHPRMARLEGHAVTVTKRADPLYVAHPGMNGLCKAMAQGLNVALKNRVSLITRSGTSKWHLTCEQGATLGVFDWVICTAPAEQAYALMPDSFLHRTTLAQARMSGCYSLMLGGLDVAGLPWEAATVDNNPIAWIAIDSHKPGRPAAPAVLCQSSNDWAESRLDDILANEVQADLLKAFEQVTGLKPEKAAYIGLHKWRYAKVETAAGKPYLLDADAGLAACGDWCTAGRVEAAFDSATGLAQAVLENIPA